MFLLVRGDQLVLEEPPADISVYGSASAGKGNNLQLPRSQGTSNRREDIQPALQ